MRHDPGLPAGAGTLAALAPTDPLIADLQTSLSAELQLLAAGFADPAAAARRLRGWHANAGAGERRALDMMQSALIAEIGRSADADATLAALDEIVGRLPADVALFAPLEARPSLRASLLRLLAHAPALARHLVTQPALIERLIDSRAYAPLPSPAQLDAEFAALIDEEDRAAGRMRIARTIEGYRFGLGLQLLEATDDAIDIAAANADLAEAGLKAMADDVLARMKENHGVVPGAELVILALGRFGGRSLTSSSDLDIIYLFTGDYRMNSDGRKPLDANEYFSRVAQQITTALSTVTPLGALYEVDTRLRPWGAKGMLACSTETYLRYHGENAWTWEHMALTRARPVYGTDAARREVKAIVNQRLRSPRDRDALFQDAIKMRGDIARHKPPSGVFDVKLLSGGLVDLEFAVHVNQLDRHVGIHPRLRTAIRSQVSAGLLDPAVIVAHQTLSRMLIVLRLFEAGCQTPVPEQRTVIAQACGCEDWCTLVEAYDNARKAVTAAWSTVIARHTG